MEIQYVRLHDIRNILQPLFFESRKWSDIKDFMIRNLFCEESTIIIESIEKYNSGKKRFPPHDDVYYTLGWSDVAFRFILRRDTEKSPYKKPKIPAFANVNIYNTYFKGIQDKKATWNEWEEYIRSNLSKEDANTLIKRLAYTRNGRLRIDTSILYSVEWNGKVVRLEK